MNVSIKNKDNFTQNLSSFRKEVCLTFHLEIFMSYFLGWNHLERVTNSGKRRHRLCGQPIHDGLKKVSLQDRFCCFRCSYLFTFNCCYFIDYSEHVQVKIIFNVFHKSIVAFFFALMLITLLSLENLWKLDDSNSGFMKKGFIA